MKWPVFSVHSNRHPPYVRHLVWLALRNIANEMAHVECFEEMVGTREAADGDRVRRGRDGDETGDETGGSRDETDDKTAATAGDK